MKKVMFVLPSLQGGGAERVAANLLNYFASSFCLSLVLFESKLDYQIPATVKLHILGKKRKVDFFSLPVKLKQLLESEKPDLVLSFLNYANFVSLLAKKSFKGKVPVLVSEHSPPSLNLQTQSFAPIKRFFIKKLYPLSEKVVAVSQGVAVDLRKNYRLPAEKISIIYNPVNLDLVKKLAGKKTKKATEPLTVAYVGRLTKEKGIPFLLQALAQVSIKYPNLQLLLVGDGEEKEKLKEFTSKLNLTEKVKFLGFQANPFKYLSQADLFVLPSLWEGLGNVIIEAMACGVPVIATNPLFSGPQEIISHEQTGLLVPPGDSSSLAVAIEHLLSNPQLRQQLVKNALEKVDDFSLQNIGKKYEELFSSFLN